MLRMYLCMVVTNCKVGHKKCAKNDDGRKTFIHADVDEHRTQVVENG